MNIIISLLIFPIISFADIEVEQIHFPKSKIQINDKVITVEVAKSQEQQKRGLMYRQNLAKDSGMLFVYDKPQKLGFWMKNTLIPLSIAYFDGNKTIINIEQMAASKTIMQLRVDVSKSNGPAQFALEMNKGWFKANGIKPGHKFKYLPNIKD